MVQEILCSKQLQNTRTDTRYFRHHPCMIHTLIFPSKIWATKYELYTANAVTAIAPAATYLWSLMTPLLGGRDASKIIS